MRVRERVDPFSRTPCAGGSSPVWIVACDGSVSGTAVRAAVNRMPAAASRSIAGVNADADAIRAKRVDRDQQDIRLRGGARRRRPHARSTWLMAEG